MEITQRDDETAGYGFISMRTQGKDMSTRKAMSSCAVETMKQGY